jgi:hypothetical protein
MPNAKESTWLCKKCDNPMTLKHYEGLKKVSKYFYKCKCGQRLLVKEIEIWLENKG